LLNKNSYKIFVRYPTENRHVEETRAQREVLLNGCKMQGFKRKVGCLNSWESTGLSKQTVTCNYFKFWYLFMPHLKKLPAAQTITASH